MSSIFQSISSPEGGGFTLIIGKEKAGEVTYKWEGENRIAIDHTEVFEGFNGQGIGKKLIHHVVEFAREKGYKIKTICPFAAKVFDQETAYADLRY